ncbi:MAG: hemagglutinin repeat-containing protein, partial [Sulfurimonas sp.]
KVSVDASEYLKLNSSKLTLSHDDFKQADDAMNLKSNNLNIVASELDAANKDINIKAQDSINISSGIERANEQHIKESKGLSLGISGGKLTYAQITKDSKTDTTITNKASNINADNIVLTSKGDTNILASNLDAKTMRVTSENNLNILSDKDVKIHNEEHTKKDIGIELTLNTKEASLFAGYWEDTKGKTTTNKDVVKSTFNIGSLDVSAKNVNIVGSDVFTNDMSINSQNTKIISSKSTTDIENYTKSVKSGVSVGVKQNISSAIESVKNIADAKEATGGISRTLKAYDAVSSFLQKPVDAGVYAIYEQSQTNTKTSMEQAVASNVYATNNITLHSNENLEVGGSSIYAAKNLSIEAKNIDIHSTTQNYSQETSFGSRNAKVGLYGTKMGEVTLGFQDASQDTHATTESNSYVVAGNKAIITSEEDTTLKGAIVRASDLEVSTGRNLTMQSVQDTQSIKGKSIGGTVSGNVATMTLNGASVNTGSTKGDKKWVNEVTSLNGENSIKVSVAETTTLKGASITNLDANGMDKGNLQLSTKELKSEDIQDFDNYKSTNIGISIGSVDSTPSLNSIDFANSTKDKEQIVRATVGEGTITTDSDIADLNRDTSKIKEITKDESSNLELYVSESSLKALLNPVQAYNDMKQKAKDVGLASHKEIVENLPSASKGKNGQGDFIDNTIGSLVDAGGEWAFGVIPTVKNDGGYISQIATQVFGDNRDILKTTDESKFIALGLNKDNGDYIQTTIDGETVYLTNPNKTVRIDENINPNDPLKEYKIHLTSQNIQDAGINTIFTNGLNNLANEALTNQQQQQGNPTIGMLNYNTSHGTLADLIETGLEKSIITLDTIPGIKELGYMINGSARQTGDSINQLTKINNGNINIAAHSQGTQQTYLGLQQHQEEIAQLLKDNPNAVLTLQNSGSPVSSKAVEDLVVNELYGGKNGIEIRFGEGKDDAINVFRSQVNPGDFIGMLGGNFGGINNNAPITLGDFWNQAGYDITRGVPTLMNGSLQNNQNDPTKTSPHSGYPCVIGCGDNGATPKEVFKYYEQNAQENIPLFDYYIKIEVEPSKAKFNTGSN